MDVHRHMRLMPGGYGEDGHVAHAHAVLDTRPVAAGIRELPRYLVGGREMGEMFSWYIDAEVVGRFCLGMSEMLSKTALLQRDAGRLWSVSSSQSKMENRGVIFQGLEIESP